MRLSKGRVDLEGCLVCPYHGWRYWADGRLETSSTPQLKHNTEFFETREAYGLIWLKQSDSDAQFPQLDFGNCRYVGTLVQYVDTPLEVALDNFTEVEHTGTAHAYFGYAQQRTAEIQTSLEVSPTTTSVINKGPQRPFPWILRPVAEAQTNDWFFNTWVTHFSPVYTFYDQYWLSPDEQTTRELRLRIAIFFNPIDECRTQLMTLIYGRSWWIQFGAWSIVRPILAAMTKYELGLDEKILNAMADKSPTLRGKKLGRFDQPLIQNRKRIESIYRGIQLPAVPDAASATSCP